MPCFAPRDRVVVGPSATMTASYSFAALPDQRLLADGKCSAYLMDQHFRWTVLHSTRVQPPKVPNRPAAFQRVLAAALMSDGKDTSVCVYATGKGLFYNAHAQSEPLKLIDGRVDGIFRQHDHLYAVSAGPVLHELALTTQTRQVTATQVFKTRRKKSVFGFFNCFIGGFYDEEKGRLMLGASNAMVYVFYKDDRMDRVFHERMEAFRSSEMRAYANGSKVEKGNLMYYDADMKECVYIGTKYVMKVSMAAEPKRFAVVRDLKHWLKGISFDCAPVLYIYHQKTIVVLKRVQAAAQCPFQMRVYTGNKLRFE